MSFSSNVITIGLGIGTRNATGLAEVFTQINGRLWWTLPFLEALTAHVLANKIALLECGFNISKSGCLSISILWMHSCLLHHCLLEASKLGGRFGWRCRNGSGVG
jgi:hypothetical protein